MDLIVKRGWVDNGEKVHGYGETVRVLNENEARRLIKSGMCEPALSAFSVSEKVEVESKLRLPDQHESQTIQTQEDQNQSQEELTPEEFAEAKAEDQKRILTEIGIEPASKEEVRIEQYTGWYNQPIPE